MGKNKADVLASSHRNTINKKIIKIMEIMSACLFDFSVVVFAVVFSFSRTHFTLHLINPEYHS